MDDTFRTMQSARLPSPTGFYSKDVGKSRVGPQSYWRKCKSTGLMEEVVAEPLMSPFLWIDVGRKSLQVWPLEIKTVAISKWHKQHTQMLAFYLREIKITYVSRSSRPNRSKNALFACHMNQPAKPLCRDGSVKWVAVQDYSDKPFGGREEERKTISGIERDTEEMVKAYGVTTPWSCSLISCFPSLVISWLLEASGSGRLQVWE